MAINDSDLLLHLPFDEAGNSATAYDYAGGRNDAKIDRASFVQGRQGNCLLFDGTGSALVDADIINFAGDFTLLAWVRPLSIDAAQNAHLGLLFNTAEINGSRAVWYDLRAGEWYYLGIRKQGADVTIFIDGRPTNTITLDKELTGMGVIQDIYCTDLAVANLDDVKLYGAALSDDDIAGSLSNVSTLEYYINGVNFKDLGIRVSSSSGVLDLPKLKALRSTSWTDYHGEVVDLYDKRVEPRTITLNCWIRAAGKIDFVEKVNQLSRHFMADGTARLMIEIHPTKPLVFEVYAPEGISHDKRWHDDKMIGQFTLKLKEPDPVKRVLRHQCNSKETASVTVGFKSEKVVTIHWGDGTTDNDLWGNFTGDNAITHTYKAGGTYYPIIAGVVEDMTDFTTNAIIVWDMI